MKKILKSILVAVALLIALSARAHQPDISSFTLIEQKPGQWMLQLNASMTAFQYEVKNAYGDDSYASPEEFNQLLLSHLKKQITIKVNGEDVTLGNGMVKLGHATTAAFEISGISEVVEEVFVINKGFENIHHSRVIFSIVKEGFDRGRIVLSEDNNYQLKISLKDNQVLLAEVPLNDNWMTLAFTLIIAGLAGFFLYIGRFRMKPQ